MLEGKQGHRSRGAHFLPPHSYSFTRLSRKAFVTTDTELIAIAAPAKMGESKMPKNGNSTPAAMGTPNAL
jgi:hypothetical protein